MPLVSVKTAFFDVGGWHRRVADKKKPVRSKGAKAKAATKPLAKAAKTRSSARRRRKDSSDDDDVEAEEDDYDDDALVA